MVFYRASLAVLIQWPPPPDNPQKCEMLYLNNGWSVSLTDLGSTLAMVCCHAPETVCDVVQRFSLSGHPLLITLKNAKCSIARMGCPFLSQIWDPLLLWYVPMPLKPFVTWCSSSLSGATPPGAPQKCENALSQEWVVRFSHKFGIHSFYSISPCPLNRL
jgi:hypothetical protein